jgi:hypothetical protein
LEPGPPDKWRRLAANVEKALGGQLSLEPDALTQTIVEKITPEQEIHSPSADSEEGRWLTVDTENFSTEEAREAGPVHVGHQIWNKLQITEALTEAGLDEKACLLRPRSWFNKNSTVLC